MHIRDQKRDLRIAIGERLKHMSTEDQDIESRSLCRRLKKEIPEGKNVCLYWAMKTEPNLRTLVDTLIKRGNRLFLPCFDGKLIFREIEKGMKLEKGELKTFEPPKSAKKMNSEEADIVIVPGRGYSKSGERLGRGNGGYDIWIREQRETNPETKFWGVCFECQIVNDIPMETHDEIVDAVMTARGWVKN